MGNKNTIEFNGQVYDALSGKLLKSKTAEPKKLSKSKATDGFIKSKPPANQTSSTAKPSQPLKPLKPMPSTTRQPTKHRSHQPSRSTTLMRTAVSKPGKRPIDQVQAPALSTPAKHLKASSIAARLSINERRLARAQQTGQSRLVSRFKPLGSGRPAVKFQPLPLKKPAPPGTMAPHAKTIRQSAAARLDNILSTGLSRANSHEQPAPNIKKSRHGQPKVFKRRWLIAIIVVLIVIVVGGFVVAYFHENIEFNIAEARSGVHIQLPSNRPNGFKLTSTIKNASDSLTVNYTDKVTGQQFYILAQNSSWDSQTLLDSVVLPANSHYQTVVQAGRIIYIYGPGAATWVNGGLWYEIGGDAGLTNPQLIAIATSM